MASEKVTAMIEEVKALSVLELAELVHAIEDAFGVSAAAAVRSFWKRQPGCAAFSCWMHSCDQILSFYPSGKSCPLAKTRLL